MIPDGYIRTYTGRLFNPLDPDPEQIDPIDIAHSLSLVNRFTGHTNQPYSVAQHSCLAFDLVFESKPHALLHDASEAYLADLARPVKKQLEMTAYRKVEKRIMDAVFERFDLATEIPEEVHVADSLLLWTELRDFMDEDPDGNAVLVRRIEPWNWRTSKTEFINRLSRIGIEVGAILV